MHKLRVGVLMGGKSIEREVSFNSGRTVCDHLDTARYEVVPLFQNKNGTLFVLPWHFLHRGKINDFAHRLTSEAENLTWDELKERVDFVYIAVHGRYAEDGTLQGMLEVLGIPYLGSDVFAAALSMDKAMQKKFLTAADVHVPRGIALTPHEINTLDTQKLHELLEQHKLQLPLVVKPNEEGSSLGVSVVFEHAQVLSAIKNACTIHKTKPQTVLVEEKIEGMEFSCIILTDYQTGELLPLPPTEIVHEKNTHFFDYEQKYMPGRAHKFTPARCESEMISTIQDACMRTMRALNITNIARIDGFVTSDYHVVIVDPNILSGMGPASFVFREAAEIDMSHTRLINHLIETELQAYGMLDALIKHEKENTHTMDTPKLRVAVLMGGATHEREVSLESGRNVTYKLSPHKYEVIPLFVSSTMELFELNQSLLVRNSTAEIEALVEPNMQLRWQDLQHRADFVFIALHGGVGENGSVQGTLEMLGIPYNGSSVLTSALCMDKYKANKFLASNGFHVPRSKLIERTQWHTTQQEVLAALDIPFPLIVKPHDDGCSVMVRKVLNEAELREAIDELFARDKQHAFVEECITGMELTVGVTGNETPKALPPSQAVTYNDVLSIEEKFLPGAGENQTPAPLPPTTLKLIQREVERAYAALGCTGYARIDCFYTPDERIVFIEVNSLPALTPATCLFHQAAEVGIRPMDLIDQIINYGLEKHTAHAVAIKNKELEVAS